MRLCLLTLGGISDNRILRKKTISYIAANTPQQAVNEMKEKVIAHQFPVKKIITSL